MRSGSSEARIQRDKQARKPRGAASATTLHLPHYLRRRHACPPGLLTPCAVALGIPRHLGATIQAVCDILIAMPKVKNFAAPTNHGGTFKLSDHAGQVVVLYFYPKDATPGCTTEGLDFAALHKKFVAANALVAGVSRDSVKSHDKFCEKHGFPFPLLSDEDEQLCAQFDVIKMKNMYGKQVRGIERSTFVIGADGKIAKEWRGVKVAGHAQEVLDFVKTLA